MHEWALAEAVLLTVAAAAQKENFRKVTKVKVKMGELQQIDPDLFQFALENCLQAAEHLPAQPPESLPEQRSEYLFDRTRIELETEPCILRCRVCQHAWPFRESLVQLPEQERECIHFIPEVAQVYIRCPGCGSPDFAVRQGRGVRIAYIEGES